MLFLFYGSDEFRRSEALAELRAAFPPDVADLNITNLDGRKLKIEALVAASEAFPFLADKRMVIVHDALKNLKAGKDRDELRAYLERVPDICDLIFVEREDVDRRSTIFNYLKKSGEVREFLPLPSAELLRWLAGRAKTLGTPLNAAAAQRLVEFAGSDSRTLINELAKISAYVGRGNPITPAVIDLLVTDQQEQNLFAFIDTLGARRLGPALSGARALLAEGQAAPYVMFMLARQVRILLGVRELAQQRMRPDDIAAQLGQKPFVVRKAMDQARSFNAGELERLHDRLLELDLALKTGRIHADTALELFVAEACIS
ncbi:MAG: DNA polymerase III subunit delta [Oscillochloris sp.]|nr:DNA polymerase III subunit delta [Oscillochloris sp.]